MNVVSKVAFWKTGKQGVFFRLKDGRKFFAKGDFKTWLRSGVVVAFDEGTEKLSGTPEALGLRVVYDGRSVESIQEDLANAQMTARLLAYAGGLAQREVSRLLPELQAARKAMAFDDKDLEVNDLKGD